MRPLSPLALARRSPRRLSAGCQDAVAAPGVGGSLQTTEALAVLPTDADVVGMMDLAAARQSDALAAVTGGAGLDMLSPGGSAEFDAFVRQTGFDPGRDLDRVYLAAPAVGRTDGRAAFVGYGHFSRERVERFLATQTEHPVTTTDVGGVALYLDDRRRRPHGAASPSPTTAWSLAGDEATVRQMLGRMGTTGTTPSADVQALLDRVAFPDGAWFVARHLDARRAAHEPGRARPLSPRASRAASPSRWTSAATASPSAPSSRRPSRPTSPTCSAAASRPPASARPTSRPILRALDGVDGRPRPPAASPSRPSSRRPCSPRCTPTVSPDRLRLHACHPDLRLGVASSCLATEARVRSRAVRPAQRRIV